MRLRKLHKYLFTGCIAVIGSGNFAGAQNVVYDWARQLSGVNQDDYTDGNAMVLDAERNIYITGNFSGTVDFDPGTGTHYMASAGGVYFNAFVCKLDAAGGFVWSKQLGGISGMESYAIAVDENKNVYTTGYFQSTADFDPGSGVYNLTTGATEASIFISKLDSMGNFVWAKKIGDGSWDASSSMVIDNGYLYISGQFDGTVDFDPGAGISNLTASSSSNVFVLKLDTSGNFVWVKQLGGTGTIENTSITVNKDGVYTTGKFNGTIDFDPSSTSYNLTSVGFGSSIYISKLSNDGDFVFTKSINDGLLGASGNAISVDAQNNVYTAGFFSGTVDFDPGPGVSNLSYTGSFDIDGFVLKLDSTGNYIWARKIGGPAFEDCRGMSLDNLGNVYLTGYFSATTDFDPGVGTYTLSAIGTDIYVAKLDSAGNFVWAKQTGHAATTYNNGIGRKIVLDKGANIYTTGKFTGLMDFDPGPGTANMDAGLIYSDDAFIHKLICTDTSSSSLQITTDSCRSYVLNGINYTQSGTYVQRIPNAVGCDSTITLNLTITNNLNVQLTINGFILGTIGSYATYQWYLNGVPIVGATNSTYNASENGDYKVVVTTVQGCEDTSNIYTVTNVTGINDLNGIGNQIEIYPNPEKDIVYVKAPVKLLLVLTSVDGKVLLRANSDKLNLNSLASGMYFLMILDADGNQLKIERITKQ